MSLDFQSDFEQLIAENRARLARIARAYANRGETEDLLQDILLQLWRSRGGFRGQSTASTWLYRVALNTAISHCRRRRPPTTSDPIDPVGSTGDPLDEQVLLATFLRSLNEIDRSTLLLYLEGLDHPQIAQVLGASAGAVAVRLTRLRKRFEAQYVEDAA